MRTDPTCLKFNDFHWDSVATIGYKPSDVTTFCGVTRQNLIAPQAGIDFEVRYFEVAKSGYTTLENHQHAHVIMIARGNGKIIIGDSIFDANVFDYFVVPEWAPHQLINAAEEPFAFFCTVNARRDKFNLLSTDEIEEIRKNTEIDRWIKVPMPV